MVQISRVMLVADFFSTVYGRIEDEMFVFQDIQWSKIMDAMTEL